MPTYRLGRKPAKTDARTLRMARYFNENLPAPPNEAGWQAAVPASAWSIDGNDAYGDCVVAAAAHQIEGWTYTTHPQDPIDISSAQVVEDYLALTGGQDTGLVILDFLNAWRQRGLVTGLGAHPTDQIHAYASVSPQNGLEVRQAVELFGGCFVGLDLPDFAVNTPDDLAVPWVVPPGGAVGPSAAPNPNNGHAVVILGYDPNGLYVLTWGQVKVMGWDFLSAYATEAYALLSADWLDPSNITPGGLDMAQLEADLAQITQPSPAPPAPPSPASPCSATLAQAEKDLESGSIAAGVDGLLSAIFCYVEAGGIGARDVIAAFLKRASHYAEA